MNNFESIDKPFNALRQLPLEVSFNQVEKWIKKAPSANLTRSQWSFFKWLFPSKDKS